MWDIGGGCRLRALWRHYYQDSHVIFFVIDALDRSSLRCSSDDCKDCVYCVHRQIVQEIDHLSRKPQICFLFDKFDGFDPVSIETTRETMELQPASPIFQVSAVTGQGIHQTLDWVIDNVPL
ncbi:hypothetical protein GEMRC1_010945 [Eukaryota sp. GEM-RC1]